jgi:protein tyrosine phosphatase (PTP) superfamily phosphohydrolase (DUF442 family)
MDEEFHIATISLAGGSRLGLCRLPGLKESYEADLTDLTDWRPDIVVSMTTRSEMHEAGSADLGQIIQRSGIAWFHIPIEGFGGLNAENIARWSRLSGQVHLCLDQGGAVLFHCRGGQGRSGMMVLRVLVERGADPKYALEQLRAERPEAVETSAQLRWAMSDSTGRG